MSDKHIFALYTHHKFPSTKHLGCDRPYTFTDDNLWHRINHILRIDPGQDVILFDGTIKVHAHLMDHAKKNIISFTVLDASETQPLEPHIHLYQGLLRREAFNEVVYLAAQMGVTSFTPVLSAKVQRSWGGQKENERLRSVMIAACEQAKQFTIPIINEPIEVSLLTEHLISINARSLYCEPEGQSLLYALNDIAQKKYDAINVCIGPEGGFTDQEQSCLKKADVACYALTPTILRAQEAVAVCIGAIRSVLGRVEQ